MIGHARIITDLQTKWMFDKSYSWHRLADSKKCKPISTQEHYPFPLFRFPFPKVLERLEKGQSCATTDLKWLRNSCYPATLLNLLRSEAIWPRAACCSWRAVQISKQVAAQASTYQGWDVTCTVCRICRGCSVLLISFEVVSEKARSTDLGRFVDSLHLEYP